MMRSVSCWQNVLLMFAVAPAIGTVFVRWALRDEPPSFPRTFVGLALGMAAFYAFECYGLGRLGSVCACRGY